MLSVVIPTFNAENSIIKTIHSILEASQKLKEVIIIDDCSTDDTLRIVQDFAKNNSLQKVIRIFSLPENSGPAVARQVGFSKVQGDFVIFFDADDEMLPNVIDPTLQKMLSDDVPVSVFKYWIDSGSNRRKEMWPEDERIFSKLQDLGEIINPRENSEILVMTNYPWNKICSTKYMNALNIDFGHFRLHEDVLLHWQILMNAPSILLVDAAICNYNLSQTENHMTHDKSAKRLVSLSVLDWLRNYVYSCDQYKVFRWSFIKFYYILTCWAYDNIDHEHRKEFRRLEGDLLMKLPFSAILSAFKNDNMVFDHIYAILRARKNGY